MSDGEEPPSKMSKYEEYLDDAEEEWLSEGGLTDDDYRATSPHHVKIDSNMVQTKQEDHDTMTSSQEMESLDHSNGKDNLGQNIEDTLNNLDSKNELSEDLNTYLIRKTDGKILQAKVKEEKLEKRVKEEDDGNDTDDLLRMLEDNQQDKKKTIKFKSQKAAGQDDSTDDDDDEFIYERSKVRTIKLTKNTLIKQVSKAEPEQMSDSDETDASSDERATMKNMFGVKKATPRAVNKPTVVKKVMKHFVHVNTPLNKPKPKQQPNIPNTTPNKLKIETVKPKIEPNNYKSDNTEHKKDTTTPKTDTNKPKIVTNKPKTDTGNPKIATNKPKIDISKFKNVTVKPKIDPKPFKMTDVKTPTQFKSLEKSLTKLGKPLAPKGSEEKVFNIEVDEAKKIKEEPDEIINEEEFLEDDHFGLDEEEFAEDGLDKSKKQRLMKPEMMDEEVPSDEESHSEDGSLYDELPSSDSEDFDDWFTLDIRSERASDYLPLLGASASSLLSDERQRAANRVASLRQSLSALTESARRQADALRHAAMALAEIDDTLRAS